MYVLARAIGFSTQFSKITSLERQTVRVCAGPVHLQAGGTQELPHVQHLGKISLLARVLTSEVARRCRSYLKFLHASSFDTVFRARIELSHCNAIA